MSVMTRATVPAGPWTVDDLDDVPEGSTTRYELVDGALLVSAEPSLQHQRVGLQLARLLHDAAPAELEVLLPVDVRLSPVRQEAGVPSYWLVDPDDGVVTVLELEGGAYREVARGPHVTVQRPFPVEVRLSR